MRLGPSLAISFASLVVAATIPGACGLDGIVGGTCKGGLSNCANRCVNLDTDRKNCGRCGKRCADGVDCIKGFCGGKGEGGWGGDDAFAGSGNHRRDGGVSGTRVDAGTLSDAFTEFDVVYPDGSAGGTTGGIGSGTTSGIGSGTTGGTGSGITGGTGSGTAGTTGEVCVPPYDTATHCGACDRACVYPNRVCAPIEGGYGCVPLCNAPLIECSGACVDLNSDSDNCGQCGRVCPSAICQGGQCIGAQAGHIVIIGMNFRETSRNSQATKILANAVLMPRFNPIKILAYNEFAEPAVTAAVDTTIDWASSLIIGRDHDITSINQPQLVNEQLKKPDYDAFLVYEQALAPAGTLAAYGTQWAKTLESFSFVGGVIVVLSGSTGTKEMPQFLTNARLMEVSAETSVSHLHVFNRQPTDAIVSDVVTTFLAPLDSCVFTTPPPSDNSTVFVVTDDATPASAQRPVVVHRTAIPQVE